MKPITDWLEQRITTLDAELTTTPAQSPERWALRLRVAALRRERDELNGAVFEGQELQ